MHKNFLNYIRRYDEYYTKYEHVEDIFDRYIPYDKLKDKIIYCPCDSDKSNFVIYLKEHKDDLQYKELIYTSDDYNTHLDLFEYCDVIITNPPFSKLVKEFIPILNKVNKKFFILGSLVSLCSYFENFEDKTIKYVRSDKYFDFIIPEDCNLPNCPMYIYISNLNINSYYKEPLFDKKQTNEVIAYINGIEYKEYDKISNIPKNEYNTIVVPSTVILEHNKKYFNIISVATRHNVTYSDNKKRYRRLIVKRKL